jgi:ribA/ribD-fused uncharacterized protein
MDDYSPTKLDTQEQVFFYEQEFYVLSNFSAFTLIWRGIRFDTSEAAYHYGRFKGRPDIRLKIVEAISAHEAFKIAQECKRYQDSEWDDVKVSYMKEILWEKVTQHPYVKKKLMETGDREVIEDSWRDDFWGWGEEKNGSNQLGKLWMKIREEIRNES